MFEYILSIIAGGAVVMFGMWCYVRGEQNGQRIARSQQPQQIVTPVQAVSNAVQAVKEHVENGKDKKKSLSLAEQIQKMQNY